MTVEDAYQYHDVARSEMVAYVPASAITVLDVGCGLGGFGAELRRQRPHVRVTGVEADASAAHRAAPRYDEMLTGRFPDVVGGRLYDCIVFNDVLEHLVDPWAALRAAGELLVPSGRVVASIPNLRYAMVLAHLVFNRQFAYVDDGVLDRTHLRFFTGPSSAQLFMDSGYNVERLESINHVDIDALPRPHRRVLRLLAVVRPGLALDLRAQQYAVVAHAAG